jgi:hypothetical protein
MSGRPARIGLRPELEGAAREASSLDIFLLGVRMEPDTVSCLTTSLAVFVESAIRLLKRRNDNAMISNCNLCGWIVLGRFVGDLILHAKLVGPIMFATLDFRTGPHANEVDVPETYFNFNLWGCAMSTRPIVCGWFFHCRTLVFDDRYNFTDSRTAIVTK